MDGSTALAIKDAMEALDADLLNTHGTTREELMELAGQHAIRAEAILKIMEDDDRDKLGPVLVGIVEGGFTQDIVAEDEASDADIALISASETVHKLMASLDAHTEYGPVFMFTGSDHLELDAEHHTQDQILLAHSIRNNLIDLSNIFGTNVPSLVLSDRSIN